MINERTLKKWLNETKNTNINVCWLDIALKITNDDGVLSKEIEPDKMLQTDYPDLIQEIQAWIAKIIVAKRFSLISQCKVKKKLLKVIHELENFPDDLIKIFYKYRYIFKKQKNEDK